MRKQLAIGDLNHPKGQDNLEIGIQAGRTADIDV